GKILGKISDALDKSNIQKAIDQDVDQGPTNKSLNIISVKNQENQIDVSLKKGHSFPNGDENSHLNENLITVLNPQSYEAEQFRMLKSSLLFPAVGPPPRSILITSAIAGEGKSFISSNTAVSIAQNIDEHVLLMDCDIRSPSIHKLFGFSRKLPGLSDYLSKDISLPSLLLKTKINKLTILPAGKAPDNPAELLSSGKMSELVDELKERYHDRYIIIDSPPLNLISETSVLAKLVDKVILVVNYRKTKRDMVTDLIEIVGKEKILGIVINKFDPTDISYGYHSYYKNYKYGGKN
ncbi:polysaccharide biosynthesis tyrosine autokinase, partial [bacterium]|nr:polysaccharide biosynthesis tyrosine autokinase [bacterium]